MRGRRALRNPRLAANISWNITSGVASIFGLLLLYPLSVNAAGPENYGLWVLAFGTIQLFTMADFGLGTGIVRTLAGLEPDLGNLSRRRFVTIATCVFLALAIVLTLLFIVLFGQYLKSVSIPPHLVELIPVILLIAASSLFISIMGRCANSVLWAEDRPDIERKASLLGLGIRAVGIITVQFSGGGLLGVIIVESVSIAVPSAICGVVVAMKYGRPIFDRSAFKLHTTPLLRTSGALFVGSFTAVAATQLPLYIVGSNLGLTAATAFGALLRVFQSARLTISWLTNPFTHKLASTTVSNLQLRTAVTRCFQLTGVTSILITIPLVLLPSQILEVWLGKEFLFASSSLALIAMAVVSNAIILPSALITNLRSNPWPTSILGVILLGLTAIGVFLGVQANSIFWATVGMAVPLAVMAPIYLALAHRVMALRLHRRTLVDAGLFIISFFVLGISTYLVAGAVSSIQALLYYAVLAGVFSASLLLVLRKKSRTAAA
ncbi:lipopolysaccharide biosynthesis protein [Paenarthrobacter nitroguajacolicus]|uniref:lipopolysaccharide biosynthesis protein n=2 Tax=Paenarthrobacter nitroguajacolicus TaxID=211146 RepID=UPI0034167942